MIISVRGFWGQGGGMLRNVERGMTRVGFLGMLISTIALSGLFSGSLS